MITKTIAKTAVVRYFPGLRVLRVYPYGNRRDAYEIDLDRRRDQGPGPAGAGASGARIVSNGHNRSTGDQARQAQERVVRQRVRSAPFTANHGPADRPRSAHPAVSKQA